ncbi:MAG TPA: cytochrome b N-terminal domain-containing protein [bacterium]|nr:cytochrome b N-terminal domain-containing protein [bacterium]
MWRRAVAWVDERLNVMPLWHGFLDRKVPKGIGWFHVFGSATLFLLVLQFATGIFLTVYYAPSTEHAYESIKFINEQVPFGKYVAGIHLWSASILVVVIGVHMLRTFAYGAYKYPRETTWITGVVLLFLVLAFAFTGYLLPYDQKAYWATVVGTNIAGAGPFVGDWALRVLRGGTAVGALTLQRFYAFHIWLLPAALALFVAAHLFMVIRQGIAAPPRRRPLDLGADAAGLPRREVYERQYAMEKQAGHPFYVSILKDAVFALLLFLAVSALALTLGTPLEPPANPNATTYVPRPEWYFLDFFQLLWYLQGQWEPLGIFLIVLGVVLVLLLLPFYDRSPERHPVRRPIAMASAVIAIVAVMGLTYLGARSPGSAPAPAAAGGAAVPPGAREFQTQGCAGCHTIAGVGGTAGPNLSHIGGLLTRAQLQTTILNGATGMPAFSHISPEALNALLNYLESLK